MKKHFMIALKLVLVGTVLLGLAYPLAVTGISQLLFAKQANGSLLSRNDRLVGSRLIGQPFAAARYFHPRPSAAGSGYDASASSGSNLGPTSKALAARVSADIERLMKENPGLRKGDIPADMVTNSGSGLDPDISPANAYAQAARVAGARDIPESQVKELIANHITGRQFGILGEPRVNVLGLNIALDGLGKSR